MKKVFLILSLAILLSSCHQDIWKKDSLQKTISKKYNSEKAMLDLSDMWLKWSVNLSRYLTGSLRIVDLSWNQLQNIDLTSFTWLLAVNLSSNDFQFGSDIKLPKSIKQLNLDDNKLQNLDWFSNYTNLESLSLKNNNLEDKHLAIKWLNKLKRLYISGNNISKELSKKISEANK